MLKTGRMDAFTGFSASLPDDGTFDEVAVVAEAEASEVVLPNIQILTCTSAADAGISSTPLEDGHQKGFPASAYALSQNSGRVDRLMRALRGECSYEVHVSFDSLLSLYVRIMKGEIPAERVRQLDDLMFVEDF